MVRQSISFTSPNDDWLRSQVESQEYSSKSDVVNDLIRQARAREAEIGMVRARLIKAEQGGFTTAGKAEIRAEARRGV